MIILTIILLCVLCASKTTTSDYRRFGVQTSYFENADLDTSPVSVPGCEPAYFWFLARHGARRPEANDIQDMETYQDLGIELWRPGQLAMGN